MRCRSLSRLTQKEEEATLATFLSFCILFSHTLGGFSEAVLIIQTDKQIGAKFKESLSSGTITGIGQNIAKGTTDPRVEFILSKLLLEVISQVQTQILIKFHLQNLDQASTSKSQPNFSISTKPKPQNLD